MITINNTPYVSLVEAKAALWATPHPAEGLLIVWDENTGHDFHGIADAVKALKDGDHIKTGWMLD